MNILLKQIENDKYSSHINRSKRWVSRSYLRKIDVMVFEGFQAHLSDAWAK